MLFGGHGLRGLGALEGRYGEKQEQDVGRVLTEGRTPPFMMPLRPCLLFRSYLPRMKLEQK